MCKIKINGAYSLCLFMKDCFVDASKGGTIYVIDGYSDGMYNTTQGSTRGCGRCNPLEGISRLLCIEMYKKTLATYLQTHPSFCMS